MYPEVTSVYVPVKTKDYRTWAIILSIFGHCLLVGGILYFHNEAPPPPMETTLISPEELADLQGQIQANQQNNAATDGQMPTPQQESTMDPNTAEIMQQLAEQEAQFQANQAKFAEQLDREFLAEQQRMQNQIDQEFAATQAKIVDFERAEANIDEIRENNRRELEAARRANQQRIESLKIKIESKDMGRDGVSPPTANSHTNVGGRHELRKGAAKGNQSASYLQRIRSIIESNWNPETNSNGTKLVVYFNISPTGEISGVRVEGSANSALKNSLMNAVKSSSPLPPPPAEDYDNFKSNKFTFNTE